MNLSMVDIRKAFEFARIHENKNQLVGIELCSKHWEQLRKDIRVKDNSSAYYDLCGLYGITVTIRPYLKKPRLIYKTNTTEVKDE